MSIEDVIKELENLTEEQLDQVACMIRRFSNPRQCEGGPKHSTVPASIIEQAVSHGWPEELFSELIGSLPDLQRAPQSPIENRSKL